MTREQQVALDAMRSAWPEEVVAAMVAGPRLLDALCLMCLHFGRDMDIDERESFRFVGEALEAAHDRHVYESQTRGNAVLKRISPPETPAGVHAPQPQAPRGETECVACGGPCRHPAMDAP